MREIKAPAVLWTHDPERVGEHLLARPTLLVSAAPPDRLAGWYASRSWALSLPLVLWHRDEVDTVALRVFDVATRERGDDNYLTHRYLSPGPGPCCVTGPAALIRAAGLSPRADVDGTDPRRILDAARTAAAITRAQRSVGPVWEVCADETDGALALGAAMACGRAVAVSDERPGPLFGALGDSLGITVRAWLDNVVWARAHE